MWAGRAYVNDANTEAAAGYGVLSAMAAYTIGRARILARGENLTDRTYTNRVQVNDNGGLFFFPAPGRQATVAVQVRW